MPLIPTLDANAWVTEPAEAAEAMFAYFFASNFSQSTTFYGMISSFPYLLQQYGDDFTVLRQEVETVLQAYYARQFEKVTVNITLVPEEGRALDTSAYTMRISVILQDKGKSYSLGNLLTIANKKISKLVKI